MAYSRDLPKMARQQCSVALWIEIAVILEIEIESGDMVWFGMGGGHDWHGLLSWMNSLDDWHG